MDNQNKTKVTEAYIIVSGTKEKPYFEIMYHEVGKEHGNIGFSSSDLDNVRKWKDECLEIVGEE